MPSEGPGNGEMLLYIDFFLISLYQIYISRLIFPGSCYILGERDEKTQQKKRIKNSLFVKNTVIDRCFPSHSALNFSIGG